MFVYDIRCNKIIIITYLLIHYLFPLLCIVQLLLILICITEKCRICLKTQKMNRMNERVNHLFGFGPICHLELHLSGQCWSIMVTCLISMYIFLVHF